MIDLFGGPAGMAGRAEDAAFLRRGLRGRPMRSPATAAKGRIMPYFAPSLVQPRMRLKASTPLPPIG